MSLDLTKLSPAPWEMDETRNGVRVIATTAEGARGTLKTVCAHNTNGADKPAHAIALSDAAFIALARNAFEVMMRRGCHPECNLHGQWYVRGMNGRELVPGSDPHPDPFTALVEADLWYTLNVEGKDSHAHPEVLPPP